MYLIKRCRKGLHLLSGANYVKSGKFHKCRACYNERLKLYMRQRRLNKKKEGKDDLDYHADPLS